MSRVILSLERAEQEIRRFKKKSVQTSKVFEKLSDTQIGFMPRDALTEIEGVTLYKYQSQSATTVTIPVLVVYALVNRPEMIDLHRGRSFVESLVAKGHEVYLIDWGHASSDDPTLGLEDYVLRYLDFCVDFLREYLALERVSLLGICQGGTFSICYASLFPQKVERLITAVTPVDFHTNTDMLSHLLRQVDIENLAKISGGVSDEFLNTMFLCLKPYRLMQQKYVHFVERIDDGAAVNTFLSMEKWIFDSPIMPFRVSEGFVKNFYHGNKLVKGNLSIGGREVKTQNLTMPILNVMATDDHLVPAAASQALALITPDGAYTECFITGGHVGIFVTSNANSNLADKVDTWLRS